MTLEKMPLKTHGRARSHPFVFVSQTAFDQIETNTFEFGWTIEFYSYMTSILVDRCFVIRDYKWTSRSIIGVTRYVFYRYITKLINFLMKIKQEINSIIYPVITICNNIFVILSNLYTVVYKSIPWVIVSKEKELWQPNHEKQRTLKQTNKCFQTCLVLTSTCSLSLRIELKQPSSPSSRLLS